ncbi:MAG: hypothetical protein C0603_03915 [Denitrovibrio sp.]|nr:MAG: hypothetical protein C0603_03915 [Denitrovibrio sp.]
MKMQLEKISDKDAKLTIGGNYTVENIKEFHKKITDLLNEIDTLVLYIEKGSTFDLTFVQIICATHREFTLTGKKVCLQGDLSELFIKTDEIGYTRHKGCSLDKNHDCVLVKKGA